MNYLDIVDLDHRLFSFFNSYAGRSSIADSFFVFAAEYIVFVMVLGLGLFAVLEYKETIAKSGAATRRYLYHVLSPLLAAAVGRLIFDELIRALYFRERPFVQGVVTQLVAHNPLEPSFPSGHAAFMFGMAFTLFFMNKKWGTIFLVLATISGLARIVAGVHFPFDILVGAFVGFFAALCVWGVEKKFFGTPLGPVRRP